MTRTIRVITGRDDVVTLVHDHRKGEPFPCPRCGHAVTARPGARCDGCGAGVASVRETYPVQRRPPSKLPQPAKNRERDGMLGCLYGLYLRSTGLAADEAMKLVREKYPHLNTERAR